MFKVKRENENVSLRKQKKIRIKKEKK